MREDVLLPWNSYGFPTLRGSSRNVPSATPYRTYLYPTWIVSGENSVLRKDAPLQIRPHHYCDPTLCTIDQKVGNQHGHRSSNVYTIRI